MLVIWIVTGRNRVYCSTARQESIFPGQFQIVTYLTLVTVFVELQRFNWLVKLSQPQSHYNITKQSNRKMKFLATLLMLATGTAIANDFGIPEHAQRNLHEAVVHSYESGHRDLQLINGICNLFASFFVPGDITCNCFLTIGIVFTCSYGEPICLGDNDSGVCSTPVIKGELNILLLSATLEFCTAGTTDGGVAVPGLCIDFGGSLLNGLNIGGLFGADAAEGQKQGNLLHCTASVLGETCQSCEICDGGLGYTFDCSNIESIYVQSKCVPATIISGFFMDQEVGFLPQLDS